MFLVYFFTLEHPIGHRSQQRDFKGRYTINTQNKWKINHHTWSIHNKWHEHRSFVSDMFKYKVSGILQLPIPPIMAFENAEYESKPPRKKKVTIARLLGSEKYALYLDCLPGTTSFEIAGVGETENSYPSSEEIARMISDFEAAAMAQMNDEDFDADDEGTEKEQMGKNVDAGVRGEKSGRVRNSSGRLAKMLELTRMSLRKKRRRSMAFVQPKIRKSVLTLAKKW